MKKQLEKTLSIRKHTVANLNNLEMGKAKGGANISKELECGLTEENGSCPNSCVPRKCDSLVIYCP
ncbi:MAG: hypothetical protein GY765_18545 [bacterium]|nr:hypothetical protein [bacterium]